jgi:CheY-like chemotaxis protein
MGILGNASLMLVDMDADHAGYERLKNIEEYVQNGVDLTKQLLGFARGGKYEVKPTNLNDLVKKSARMFGRTKKEVRIHGKYQKNVWTTEVDRGQLEQVLLNLYVNAWQAMPAGGDLFLQTRNVDLDEDQVSPYGLKPGRYVEVSVTDNGVGMDSKTKERIFDPFFSTKALGRGTGLGLASAYGIVKNHDGIIRVESEPGEGTTFRIYLPVSTKEIEKDKTRTDAIVRGSETILLVDDEDLILDIGGEMLRELGYAVTTARSGAEAVTIYGEQLDRIDLVILDMIMPEMGGGETYDRLKAMNPGIKVLLSSGYSINGQAKDILARGCDGFIQKPFNLGTLSQKLREILDQESI